MKAFRFPLQRILDWRRTQLRLEEMAGQRLAATVEQLARRASLLDRDRSAAEQAVLDVDTIDAADLAAIPAFQARIRRQQQTLTVERRKLEEAMAGQAAKTAEARRKVKLLERLHAKKLEGWTAELAREQEQFAAEAFLSRWHAERRAGGFTIELNDPPAGA